MATNNKEEPNTAPQPDRWYNLTLGSSFKDHQPSSKFCTLRYEFKPASIDKSQPGTLHKNKDNRVTVEFQNNQPGKPKVNFQGTASEDYKENDAVLLFDGESFRLERLHRAVKRLKHVRPTGESAATTSAAATSLGAGPEASSPPPSKGSKFQTLNKSLPHSMPVEIERIEIGDFKSADPKPKNDKVVDYSSTQQADPFSSSSPDLDDLEQQLDIMNDDDDENDGRAEKEAPPSSHIDINIPQQNEMDDEIADVDVSDGEEEGHNAAEALRAQVNAELKGRETSSSSDSSGSESSGSGSSGSGSSSSDSESSDGDTVNSI